MVEQIPMGFRREYRHHSSEHLNDATRVSKKRSSRLAAPLCGGVRVDRTTFNEKYDLPYSTYTNGVQRNTYKSIDPREREIICITSPHDFL